MLVVMVKWLWRKTKRLVTRMVTTGVNIELTRHRKFATLLTGKRTVVVALTIAMVTVAPPLPSPVDRSLVETFVSYILRKAAAIAEKIRTTSVVTLSLVPITTMVTLHLLAKTVVFTLTLHLVV